MIGKVIDSAVSSIHESEMKKKRLSAELAHLREKNVDCVGLAEKKLVVPVIAWKPDCLIGGVDSGFVAKRLASVDLVLIRSVGVVFDFNNGILRSAFYYPNFFDFPSPHLSKNALEDDESEQSKSLMRLREEVNTTKKIIEKYNPKYCFIDGSIIPQYQDKPRKDSKISEDYSGIINEFESLYEIAERHGCTLISTVEDSRGSRIVGILKEEFGKDLDGVYDTAFLDYFLKKGERTGSFNYTKSIKQHPVLQDFSSSWSENLYGFYVKPSDFDRPLRVEFISKGNVEEKANEIASVAYALSSLHKEYAYPSVLIEADFHAKLRPDEIEIVYNKIMDKLGASVKLKMRRDNRPF